jgi:hypothetical protein
MTPSACPPMVSAKARERLLLSFLTGASTLDYNAYVTGLASGGSFYVDDAAVYLP